MLTTKTWPKSNVTTVQSSRQSDVIGFGNKGARTVPKDKEWIVWTIDSFGQFFHEWRSVEEISNSPLQCPGISPCVAVQTADEGKERRSKHCTTTHHNSVHPYHRHRHEDVSTCSASFLGSICVGTRTQWRLHSWAEEFQIHDVKIHEVSQDGEYVREQEHVQEQEYEQKQDNVKVI